MWVNHKTTALDIECSEGTFLWFFLRLGDEVFCYKSEFKQNGDILKPIELHEVSNALYWIKSHFPVGIRLH